MGVIVCRVKTCCYNAKVIGSAVGFKGSIHEPWRGNGVKLSV